MSQKFDPVKEANRRANEEYMKLMKTKPDCAHNGEAEKVDYERLRGWLRGEFLHTHQLGKSLSALLDELNSLRELGEIEKRSKAGGSWRLVLLDEIQQRVPEAGIASGLRLGVNVVLDLLDSLRADNQMLQEQVAFWSGEGDPPGPLDVEYRELIGLKRDAMSPEQLQRLREICKLMLDADPIRLWRRNQELLADKERLYFPEPKEKP